MQIKNVGNLEVDRVGKGIVGIEVGVFLYRL
jgi:hypothetical protein